MHCMKHIPSLTEYSLNELCVLADFTPRTVRYYVQSGLVDRPAGETRAARYGPLHLEQLLLIKKWTTAGVSLERVRELLHGAAAPVAERPRKPGAVEVCSRLVVADGIELLIEPTRAGLSPGQVRQLMQFVMRSYTDVSRESVADDASPNNTEKKAK